MPCAAWHRVLALNTERGSAWPRRQDLQFWRSSTRSSSQNININTAMGQTAGRQDSGSIHGELPSSRNAAAFATRRPRRVRCTTRGQGHVRNSDLMSQGALCSESRGVGASAQMSGVVAHGCSMATRRGAACGVSA
eukprot:scaffold1543_cov102-Isochrysis_galbana.AAC.2